MATRVYGIHTAVPGIVFAHQPEECVQKVLRRASRGLCSPCFRFGLCNRWCHLPGTWYNIPGIKVTRYLMWYFIFDAGMILGSAILIRVSKFTSVFPYVPRGSSKYVPGARYARIFSCFWLFSLMPRERFIYTGIWYVGALVVAMEIMYLVY